ncbi:hypothetical protein I552_7883 [Mycobacterium xenopi 3993]|nr:hypothetical protein I552_7883 [Mycobacterium xenopi 3993]
MSNRPARSTTAGAGLAIAGVCGQRLRARPAGAGLAIYRAAVLNRV